VRGGENEALLAAVNVVKNLAGNEGFSATIDFAPS
jgi:hypothetical protein